MIEWIKDFWPVCFCVAGYVILLERRLARLEGKLTIICDIFQQLVNLPNPDKKGAGKSWRFLFGRSVKLYNTKKKGGD